MIGKNTFLPAFALALTAPPGKRAPIRARTIKTGKSLGVILAWFMVSPLRII
jgi:hypothetical protein